MVIDDSECTHIANTFAFIFKLMNFYTINIQNSDIINIEKGIFYFLNKFCKYFLSKKLPTSYVYVFKKLSKIFSFDNNSEILSCIITFIVELFNFKEIFDCKHVIQLHDIIKIFRHLIDNFYIQYEQMNNEKIVFIGHLLLEETTLNKILSLHDK